MNSHRQEFFFFNTTDLYNTKIKTKLYKRTAEPYMIYGYHIGETKKGKKIKTPYICIHKYCLQSFLAEVKHLMKKPPLHLMYIE